MDDARVGPTLTLPLLEQSQLVPTSLVLFACISNGLVVVAKNCVTEIRSYRLNERSHLWRLS